MKQTLKTLLAFFVLFSTLFGCSKLDEQATAKRFIPLNSKSSGISFVNTLKETDSLNYFTYPYIYMGGGVAVGDIKHN